MTDEEKQAIEFLKIDCLITLQQINDGKLFMIEDEEKRRVSATQVLLNLIDKQQKEIEELSIIKNSIQTLETHFANDDTYYVIAKENFLEGDFRNLLDDYISRDKIRKLKEKVEQEMISNPYDFSYMINELLGE